MSWILTAVHFIQLESSDGSMKNPFKVKFKVKTSDNIPIIKLGIKASTILHLNRFSQEKENEKEKKRAMKEARTKRENYKKESVTSLQPKGKTLHTGETEMFTLLS